MFLIVTRNFPPDVGGMQVLMGGLSENLLNRSNLNVTIDPLSVATYCSPPIKNNIGPVAQPGRAADF